MWHSTERSFHPVNHVQLVLGSFVVILALCLGVGSTKVNAHALDFATLNIKPITDNHWQIDFQQTNNVPQAKLPVANQASTNNNSAIQLRLPNQCEAGYARLAMGKNNRQSIHWRVNCAGEQPLDWIAIEGGNGSQVFLQQTTLSGDTHQQLFEAGTLEFQLLQSGAVDGETKNNQASGYLTMGIKHIAIGLDHLAFVLLAVLIAATMKNILLVISAFTIGHCVTLVMASLNLIAMNQAYVEWLIALSIMFLAVEIIRGRQTITLKQPALVALAFGLLHGLGFASVLAEAGLPTENRMLALILFNLGVEIGQVLFVLLIAPLVYGLSRHAKAWPKKALVYSVGGVAGYWVIARSFML